MRYILSGSIIIYRSAGLPSYALFPVFIAHFVDRRGAAIRVVVWPSEYALLVSFMEVVLFATCRQVMDFLRQRGGPP